MSKYLHSRYSALTAYTPGEQPQDRSYVKLNTNESPYPPAPQVLAALDSQAVEALRLYPDPTGAGLRQDLAAYYGLQPEQVFLGNGSDEVLNFAFMAWGERGVAFPDVSYSFYPVYAQLHGCPTKIIPLRGNFRIDPAAYTGQAGLIVIANPNAPTGLSLSLEQVEGLLQANPQALVVMDEAYVDFGGRSCVPLLARYRNLLVVQTYSKSRSLAGLRLGYALGAAELIADLELLKFSTNPYNLDRLTLAAGKAALAGVDYYHDCCQRIIEAREDTEAALAVLGFTVLPSQANFLFVTHPQIDGGLLQQELKARGVLIRHFDQPRISAWNRISIGTPEQMLALLAAIKEILL